MKAKSRETFNHFAVIILLLFSTLLFVSCGNDQLQLPNNRLEGIIDSEDWNSDKANAYLFSTDSKYEIKFLSSEEPGTDPCAIPRPSKPYLSAVFRPSERDFSFSNVIIEPNQVVVKIHPSFSEEFIITNGFMSIYLIENANMFGYIQAILDDENTVEGSFEVRLCN